MMDAAEVREIFRGGLFEVEIHDRDGRKVKQEKPAALFGEEPDDDKISSIALVASKLLFRPLKILFFKALLFFGDWDLFSRPVEGVRNCLRSFSANLTTS